MGKIRGTHSSPGHYTKITDLSYAAKTIGLTAAGLVGETEKGPAFEPIKITKTDEYKAIFGGVNAEKFKDSQYPKYELPYIAQSFLKASDQLYVCRVLGLSGYNAGPAFVITASKGANSDSTVIAVLRSKGKYQKYASLGSPCDPVSAYDTLVFDCDEIELGKYDALNFNLDCSGVIATVNADYDGFEVNSLNYGQFNIIAKKDGNEIGKYPVSLNPGAKNYIYNVLGSNPNSGNAPLFVEELYDLMLQDLILTEKVTQIDEEVKIIKGLKINAVAEPVSDVVTIPTEFLKRKHLGLTFVCDAKAAEESDLFTEENGSGLALGHIYKVIAKTNEQGVKNYLYRELVDDNKDAIEVSEITETAGATNTVDAVYVKSMNAFMFIVDNGENQDLGFSSDMSDYHENFRCAVTPWVLSEIKGNGTNVEVKKLFRFYTISDGNCANDQVKISIANIRPDDGTFDVYIRDFYDSDANPTILESYKGLTMVPGNDKYIGLKIGTLDGSYPSKSSYVVVEVIENEMTEQCVPAGFLGYPVRSYDDVKSPTLKYNVMYDDEVKDKRQYFGVSDITGIDVDVLNYKGVNAYTEIYESGYTKPFHLDSLLNSTILESLEDEIGSDITVYLDGKSFDVEWETVDPNNTISTSDYKRPVIGSESDMEGTIYENVKVRKFTLCPYGGFDGWDIYRNSRTNTDEFKANKYKGTISNGHGDTFSRIIKAEGLSLTGNCITSDYYAYLAGINQFANTERVEINLFATPGIDYVNNKLLVDDAFEMVENRLDTLYVPTTPDKPWGASDSVDEMYSSAEAAENLEDSDISSYYGATYYPWVQYFDTTNNKYIYLPVTKDVLRNMANTDNKRYPWIAPAGMERGNVECEKMRFSTKLEDRDNVYDGRINPIMKYPEGVKVWGNKTMYDCDDTNPMNRINSVRLVLYMRKLIILSTLGLVFEPDDETLAEEFERIVKPILQEIKGDRGITDYKLNVSQTPEQMDAHELSANLFIKPTPTLEYIEINFVVTPQGINFDDIKL